MSQILNFEVAVANGLLARSGVASPPTPKPDSADVLFMRMAAGPIAGKLPVRGIAILSSKNAVLSFIEWRIVRAATRFFDVLTYVP